MKSDRVSCEGLAPVVYKFRYCVHRWLDVAIASVDCISN